jgi:hypothetical protein
MMGLAISNHAGKPLAGPIEEALILGLSHGGNDRHGEQFA